MMVRSNKNENKDIIQEFRRENTKQYKQQYAKKYNKKQLSAEDKRELVQLGKAEGITQKEVAKQIGCSERTVQIYWNTSC
jgi:transposase-like protein